MFFQVLYNLRHPFQGGLAFLFFRIAVNAVENFLRFSFQLGDGTETYRGSDPAAYAGAGGLFGIYHGGKRQRRTFRHREIIFGSYGAVSICPDYERGRQHPVLP